MGNTRNLGDLLNTDSTIATADVADGGITTAKLADDAVTQAKIGADAVGTTELANDVAISTSGAITTTGDVSLSDSSELKLGTGTDAKIYHDGNNTKFQHTGSGQLYIGSDTFNITNGATDATRATVNSTGLGMGTTSPSAQLHIDESASNSYATMRLEGSNRGGQIDMYQGSTITNQILGDQSGNLYIGSSGGYGQVALDSKLLLNSNNKAFSIKQSTFLTTLSDDASRSIVANGQGIIIVTAYSEGLTCIARHEYQNIVQIMSANSLWSNSDTDGKYCLISGTNDYSITLKNRLGGNRSLKALFIGTYQ